MLILITGVSGTGKSSVLKELRARGFAVYGIDEDELADWVDKKSGVIKDIDTYETTEDFEIHQWFAEHSWVLSISRMEELRKQYDGLVFLCGSADGIIKNAGLFDDIFNLHSDDKELIQARIMKRADNDFGKNPNELEAIFKWQETSKVALEKIGATTIDAEKSVQEITDEILNEVHRGL